MGCATQTDYDSAIERALGSRERRTDYAAATGTRRPQVAEAGHFRHRMTRLRGTQRLMVGHLSSTESQPSAQALAERLRLSALLC